MGEMMEYIALGAMIREQFVSIVRILILPRPGSLSFLFAQKDGGSMPCLPDLLGNLLARKNGGLMRNCLREGMERARVARYKVIDEESYHSDQCHEFEKKR